VVWSRLDSEWLPNRDQMSYSACQIGCACGGPTSEQAFGLAVLMSKAGLAIPASPPVRLPCYTSVLADIGDEQSLSANLSTFSGHLRRIEVCAALPPPQTHTPMHLVVAFRCF
jgi:hypothetical protein